MTATIELLDAFKRAKHIDSDNAAAKLLSVTRASVSGWRNGLSAPKPHTVADMCEGIGADVAPWLARVEAERAHSSADRKVWASLARRLGAAAAVAAVALVAGFGSSTKAHANGFQAAPETSGVYIMRNWRRRLARLFAAPRNLSRYAGSIA